MVEFSLLLLRLLLSLVFAVAGVTKLLGPRATQKTLRDFGVPSPLTTPFGWLLALAELATALLLAFDGSVWWGALLAAALLVVFIVGIGLNLLRGRRPDCRCFGELSAKPISGKTLLRNVVLICIASIFIYLADDAPRWSHLALSEDALTQLMRVAGLVGLVLLLLALFVLGWLIMNLLRQNGRLLRRIEAIEAHLGMPTSPHSMPEEISLGLPLGTEAPQFALTDFGGASRQLLDPLSAGKPLLMFFISPRCTACKELLPEIVGWEKRDTHPYEIVVVSSGSLDENKKRFGREVPANLFLQKDFEVEQAYRVSFTPSALIIGTDGTIDTPLYIGARAIHRFVAELQPTPPESAPRSDALQTEG